MNEIEEQDVTFSENTSDDSQRKAGGLSDNGKKLISLIVKIIVNATLRECDEKSNKVSEV